jgi:hypothetical protein
LYLGYTPTSLPGFIHSRFDFGDPRHVFLGLPYARSRESIGNISGHEGLQAEIAGSTKRQFQSFIRVLVEGHRRGETT